MADAKTKPHDGSVTEFIDSVANSTRRADAFELLTLFQTSTGEAPMMWGPSIIGFGQYHYKYKSGREGDWLLSGFSPRKAHLVFHLMGCYVDGGFEGQEYLLKQLGKHKMGASCLYINKLSDIDITVLGELILKSSAFMRKKYH